MTVLVTGSSRGIGKAIARKFSDQGSNVVLNCVKNSALLAETLSECQRNNPNVIAIQADVSNYAETKVMFDQIKARFGSVDILVNNAGISHIGLFSDMTPGQWEDLLAVNTKSVFNCCHLAVPEMVRQKSGCIINISSVWGVGGASCEAVYSAAKGAVNAFTKALGKELAPSGIRVNAIACGVIDTDMNAGFSVEEAAALRQSIPALRFGDPGEIADVCLFLASDAAKYIIGQTITVDGGFI